ncbi:MAG TPA: Flp family type IVb pilin [Caulobacteraceae bacterium]|nr:Flp family type IVb pilin [Caulobacteraceae bacterium]
MGEARQTERLSDAAGRRAAGGLVARLSLIGAQLARDDSGATAIEYGLIVSLIFLAIIGGVSLFATNETSMYTRIGNAVAGATR